MMRIISGIRRGKKLFSLEGDNTRPTLERVKQAFFNAIQFEIEDSTVLDLFSGSGQLGLEALSRGASFCYFNDASPNACNVIQKNIDVCKFNNICKLTCKTYTDCVKMLSGKGISLVFLDPPYRNGLIGQSLDLLYENDCLADGCIIVCESDKNDTFSVEWAKVRKEYFYSDIKVTILEKER